MVIVDADRVVTVTEARNPTDSMLAGARLGRMTHIVQGREVVAHLVPANAHIIDQDALLTAMATAMLRSEAQIIGQNTSCAAGLDAGRLFAWAWRTDVRLFNRLLAQFAELLCASCGRAVTDADTLELLRSALSDAGLGDDDIAAAQHAAAPGDDDQTRPEECSSNPARRPRTGSPR